MIIQHKLIDDMPRWNLTKEQITTRTGYTISDRILYKAQMFLRANAAHTIERKSEHGYVEYLCDTHPIRGYNVTTYTQIIIVHDKGYAYASCNCQYCATKSSICSHILAQLIRLGITEQVRVIPGTRQRTVSK